MLVALQEGSKVNRLHLEEGKLLLLIDSQEGSIHSYYYSPLPDRGVIYLEIVFVDLWTADNFVFVTE